MIAIALHASVIVNGSRVFYLDDVEMVAMRYGRNLAEGLGLVWNPGERVEGFEPRVGTRHGRGARRRRAGSARRPLREGDRLGAGVRRAGAGGPASATAGRASTTGPMPPSC